MADATTTPATDTATKITPEDLQHKLQSFQGDVQSAVESKKPTLAAIAAGGGAVLLILFFLLGKRSGRKKSAVVEIRRV